MKITRISGPAGCGKSAAMAAICNQLEQQGHAVLTVLPGSTTSAILAMCTSPVPFAIMLPDFDAARVNLDWLNDEPRLANVFCFVECAS